MIKRFAPLALLALAACSTLSPEARVRTKLLEAGVSPRMAGCLAERLSDRLSIGQLQALGRAAKLARADRGRLSFDELVYRLRALDDPEILSVTARAGLACTLAP